MLHLSEDLYAGQEERCKTYLSKALGNGLDVTERSLTSTNGEQGNGLVDTAQRGDIDGLATDGTLGTDTGGVLTGTAVDNGVAENLERVLVGHDGDLKKYILDA